MGFMGFDHVNLSVRDFRETADWYGRVFGFEVVEEGVTAEGRPWGILRAADSMLCVYEHADRSAPAPAGSRAHRVNHVGFRVADPRAWEEVMRREGLACTRWEYPHSRSWYIQDPTGYEIEVSCWKGGVVRF